MIPISEILAILAAICLLPSLYRGAVQDLKEYKFSEIHFNSLWVNLAFILIIGAYISFLIEGAWLLVVEFLIISVIATLIFSFIGFRCGSGGDWRAMIYIAWIAPFILFYVIAASALCGVIQALYWIWKDDDSEDETPWLFRKIPFAVSIFCGYVIALIWMVVTLYGSF